MITVLWPESALELARRGGEYKWCRTVIGKWVRPGKRKLSKLHSFLSLLLAPRESWKGSGRIEEQGASGVSDVSQGSQISDGLYPDPSAFLDT